VGEEVFPVGREVLGAADAPRVTVGVRPEDLEVVESGDLRIEADVVEELGADAYVYGRTRFGDSEQQIIAVCMGAIPGPRAIPCTFVPAGATCICSVSRTGRDSSADRSRHSGARRAPARLCVRLITAPHRRRVRLRIG
jgi:hypothetical protein